MRLLYFLQNYWSLLYKLWSKFLLEGINLEQESPHCCEQFATQNLIRTMGQQCLKELAHLTISREVTIAIELVIIDK